LKVLLDKVLALSATNGLSFKIHGNCNDYLGKDSGAKLIIKVPPTATFKPEENIIIGNVAFMVQLLVKHTLTVWLVNVSV
jgi:glutamate synthase domain-containing protein 3